MFLLLNLFAKIREGVGFVSVYRLLRKKTEVPSPLFPLPSSLLIVNTSLRNFAFFDFDLFPPWFFFLCSNFSRFPLVFERFKFPFSEKEVKDWIFEGFELPSFEKEEKDFILQGFKLPFSEKEEKNWILKL